MSDDFQTDPERADIASLSYVADAPHGAAAKAFFKSYFALCLAKHADQAGRLWGISLKEKGQVLRVNAGPQEVVSIYLFAKKPSYFLTLQSKNVEQHFRSNANILVARATYTFSEQNLILANQPKPLEGALADSDIKIAAQRLVDELVAAQRSPYAVHHDEALLTFLVS